MWQLEASQCKSNSNWAQLISISEWVVFLKKRKANIGAPLASNKRKNKIAPIARRPAVYVHSKQNLSVWSKIFKIEMVHQYAREALLILAEGCFIDENSAYPQR